jgi:hypothetical protein
MLFIKSQVGKALLETDVDFEALNKKGDSEFACNRHEKSNQMSVPTQCPQVLIRTSMLKTKNKSKITRVLFRMSQLSKIQVKSI